MPPARINGGALQVQAPQQIAAPRHPVVNFLLATWLGNIIAVIALVFTVFAAAWGIYTGVLGVRYGALGAQYGALQSCASLYSIGKFSAYCNTTLEAGVTPAPVVRRHTKDFGSGSNDLLGSNATSESTQTFSTIAYSFEFMPIDADDGRSALARWFEPGGINIYADTFGTGQTSMPLRSTLAQFCIVVALTLGAGVFAVVYTRPRMRVFAPIISSVRTLPSTVISLVETVKRYQMVPIPWTERYTRRLAMAEDSDDTVQGLVIKPTRPDLIGIFNGEDGLDPVIMMTDSEALLLTQDQDFEGYTTPSDPDSADDASSDTESVDLPKVQCGALPGPDTSTLWLQDEEDFVWPEDEQSQTRKRPQLWVLTSAEDLRPNNPEYTDPTPLAPTAMRPPHTIRENRRPPITCMASLGSHSVTSLDHSDCGSLDEIQPLREPFDNYSPVMSRWLQEEDRDPTRPYIASSGEDSRRMRATGISGPSSAHEPPVKKHSGYPQELDISEDENSGAISDRPHERRLVDRRLWKSLVERRSLSAVTPGKAQWMNVALRCTPKRSSRTPLSHRVHATYHRHPANMSSATTSTAVSAIAPATTPGIASVSCSHSRFWSASQARPIASRIWNAFTRTNTGPDEEQQSNIIHQLPARTFKLHKQSDKLRGKDREIDQLRYWLNGRGQQAGELFMRIGEEHKRRKEAEGRCEKLRIDVVWLRLAYDEATRKAAELEWKLFQGGNETVKENSDSEEALAEPQEGSVVVAGEKDAVAPRQGSSGLRGIIQKIIDLGSAQSRDPRTAAGLEIAGRRIAALEYKLMWSEKEVKEMWQDYPIMHAQRDAIRRDFDVQEQKLDELEEEKRELLEKVEIGNANIRRLKDEAVEREREWNESFDRIEAARPEWMDKAARLEEEIEGLEGKYERLKGKFARLKTCNENGCVAYAKLVAYSRGEHEARVKAEAKLMELGDEGTFGASCSDMDSVAEGGEVLDLFGEASAEESGGSVEGLGTD
ncbi:hypothetical protein LTS16_004435 [Friedmanniomyces endolithicus]|uniref:Uncharacterized protein n=1 Tax=Friedmanniomyces endolithicus TaxID=329885 RepID=A0AAN6J9B1_9PEZI|nr:hypothetical protein LTR82_007080 [Friedmanniomyces endolithicus]KAK0930697.1 hypothetical protein LTR57_001078 [Friedmanniomyces endolithicus]KAK1009037.1 hypothetical protein LTR54_005837 [Friedmanniomyces endolithicus]KAK1014658.1 hypothetical protein LTS01_000079 [Friedmanniomyces endolithicus]KAK1048591.1 hypothetical protein LTS16_004435 [Friedmanniomyces endolithicus]